MNQEQQSLVARLPEALLPWYEKNARALPWRKTTDPYLVWLSEICCRDCPFMLMRTCVGIMTDIF